ncbi:MAG: lysophospholipid acyltransferase family protein, partial [Verrucomicrobiota bacterium]
YSQLLPHRSAKTLISPSRDGEWITSIIQQFGFSAIRGSTSKKGALAFRELLKEIHKGKGDIGITPDGPRGPVYRVQPGVIRLSQFTGRPILPLTYHIRHKIELKSWDRFQIPLPLSEITLVIGKPRVIPRDLTDDQLQGEIEWLQNTLGK